MRPQRTQRRGRTRFGLAAGAIAFAAASGCSGPGLFARTPDRSVDAFCVNVKAVKDLDSVLASGDSARITHQLDLLHNLRDVSPPDIEPQVATLVGITEELTTTVATAKDPDVAANEVFAKHQGDLAVITSAGKAVQNYSAERCRVPLNGGSTGTASTGTSSTTTSTTSARSRPTTTTK